MEKEKKRCRVTARRAEIICRQAQKGNPHAVKLIYKIAQPIAEKVAASLKYAYSQTLGTIDPAELVSISIVQVLTSVVQNYKPAKGSSFKSYLESHIRGKLKKTLNQECKRKAILESYDESEDEDGSELGAAGTRFSYSNGNGNGKQSSIWSKISKAQLTDPGYEFAELLLDLLPALRHDPHALELLTLLLEGYKEKEICERMRLSKGKLWRKQQEMRRRAKKLFPDAGKTTNSKVLANQRGGEKRR